MPQDSGFLCIEMHLKKLDKALLMYYKRVSIPPFDTLV